ncbi:MAG: 30S ribosomal protein S15 [Spirochaetales bacterium]|nr:30S ribosomal protein S15 [Spirochaetales bacterium]
MPIAKEEKQKIIDKFGKNEKDTGNTVVQIALITERIRELTEHFKMNKKDHNSRRGLRQLIGKRKRLLDYLKKSDLNKYRETLTALNLRSSRRPVGKRGRLLNYLKNKHRETQSTPNVKKS